MALYLDGKRVVGNETKTLTWAEYQALSGEEKNNGTIYLLSDVNEEGKDNFQPVIYSTEEREIGVWIDGKPLYQKTVYIATITGPSQTVAHGISNLDWIVDYSLIGLYAGETKEIAPSSGSSSSIGMVIGTWDSTNISINVGNLSYGFSDCYLTIRYTKSSDNAGSGQWSPQGVPAVHYSTDEQVVGTWIDGSTVYEKTFTASFTNIPSGTPQNVVDISGLGINEIISSVGVCKYSAQGQGDLWESLGLHFYCYIYPSGYLQFSQTMTTQTTGRTYEVRVTIQYIKSST